MIGGSDEKKFHEKLATYNVWLGVILALGGALLAAGIAFLTTGATEINHASEVQGDLQNKMVESGVRFIESGAGGFVRPGFLQGGRGGPAGAACERNRTDYGER